MQFEKKISFHCSSPRFLMIDYTILRRRSVYKNITASKSNFLKKGNQKLQRIVTQFQTLFFHLLFRLQFASIKFNLMILIMSHSPSVLNFCGFLVSLEHLNWVEEERLVLVEHFVLDVLAYLLTFLKLLFAYRT